MIGEIWFFFLCYVYNQIQHKLQMSSARQLDYDQEKTDPDYGKRLKASLEARTAAAAARAANVAAARAAAAAAGTAGTADTIKENAIRRQKFQQQIDAIVCPDCKKTANMLENPNYKCPKCKGGVAQGGSKRKSKSHRRKKSKSQRRKKSIKRRH
jgi:ssDNA-binding Zn-finger/Zn-ribbon topoisomerase 1